MGYLLVSIRLVLAPRY